MKIVRNAAFIVMLVCSFVAFSQRASAQFCSGTVGFEPGEDFECEDDPQCWGEDVGDACRDQCNNSSCGGECAHFTSAYCYDVGGWCERGCSCNCLMD